MFFLFARDWQHPGLMARSRPGGFYNPMLPRTVALGQPLARSSKWLTKIKTVTGAFDKNIPKLFYLQKLMHLRDHPQLRQGGRSTWPPIWNKTKETAPTISGEVGVLKFVHSQPASSSKCYIVIEHENEKYVGELLFHDHAFARRMTLLLRTNIGRSIREIGDLEIP